MPSGQKSSAQILPQFRIHPSIFLALLILFLLRSGFFSIYTRSLTRRESLASYDNTWVAKQGSLLVSGNHGNRPLEHPIPKLMQEAEFQYKKKIRSQSKTLKRAVAEYKRRYRHNPPNGFDLWFKFAQRNAFQMMDEFDGLMEDLKPFWKLSGKEVRKRCKLAAYLPSIDIVKVENGTSKVQSRADPADEESGVRAQYFVNMMAPFVHNFPDMEFPINAKAESRVAIPWEQRYDLPVELEYEIPDLLNSTWNKEQNVWQIWRQTCPPNSPARRPYSSIRDSLAPGARPYLGDSDQGPGRDFQFVKGTSSAVDYCAHPFAHYSQGQFFSDRKIIPALFPIFSPAKAKGFMDIRIPSQSYWSSTPQYTYGWDKSGSRDVDPMEIPWEDKIDKIFWRGSTTGGGNTPAGFTPYYHRHRFLHMATDTTDIHRSVTYPANPPSSPINLVTTKVSIAKLNQEIMDVAFTTASEPESYPGGLDAMVAAHRFDNPVPLGRHWAYRYLLDLDGMSYSGRFFAFLASNSVPIKSTVYDEFFSDWIQPWVHFIPLSTSYKEIYNIFAYFSGPTKATLEVANSTLATVPVSNRRSVDGDKRLRKIADAGKLWKRTTGRPVDMEVFVFRLSLEWARLWADDRDAMSFGL